MYMYMSCTCTCHVHVHVFCQCSLVSVYRILFYKATMAQLDRIHMYLLCMWISYMYLFHKVLLIYCLISHTIAIAL